MYWELNLTILYMGIYIYIYIYIYLYIRNLLRTVIYATLIFNKMTNMVIQIRI